jgi:hypothetical protein
MSRAIGSAPHRHQTEYRWRQYAVAHGTRGAAALAFAVAIGACSDSALKPVSPASPAPSTALAPSGEFKSGGWGNHARAGAEEVAATERLARGVALALAEPAVRQEIKAAIASSDVREHKLHFASFLHGRGANLIAASARHGGLDAAGFAKAIAQVRDLEFYMPVTAHREKWTGGPDLLVAATAWKEDPPVAFSVDGKRQVLSKSSPPDTPTLVLVQVETDFTAQRPLNEAARAALACAPDAAQTLAAAARACETAASRHGINRYYAATEATEGLHALSFHLNDAHEMWFQGDPELEAHAVAKRSRADGSAIQFQCAGEHAVEAAFQPGIRSQEYVYDQNGNDWSGDVLLMNPAQLDTAMQAEYEGFNIVLWEDDDNACEIRQNNDNFMHDVVQSTVGVIAAGATAIAARRNAMAWATFGSRVFDLFHLATGGDDYVGILVDKSQTSYAGSYSDANFIIYTGADFNGRAQLELRSTTASSAPVGQVFVTPYPVSNLSIGSTVQMEATGYDSRGRIVGGQTTTWTSSDPNVISVSSSGVATASGGGTATVYATVGGVQSSRSIVVYGPVARIDVSPSSVDVTNGDWTQLSATAYDSHGTLLPGTSFTWSSDIPDIGTVDQSGVVSTHSIGSVMIYASADGIQGTGVVNVQDAGGCDPGTDCMRVPKPAPMNPARGARPTRKPPAIGRRLPGIR